MKRIYSVQSGYRSGKLSVIRESHRDKHGHVYYLCRCACGKQKPILRGHLITHSIKSCGCLWRKSLKTHAKKRRKNKGQSSARGLFTRYRRNAFYRGYSFELTEEQFVALTSAACAYCGQPASKLFHTKGSYGAYRCNGIDRINNSLGYTIQNSQPCCKQCNRAKGSLNHADFVNWLQCAATVTLKLATHNGVDPFFPD